MDCIYLNSDRGKLPTVGNGVIISLMSQNEENYLSKWGHISFSKISSSIDLDISKYLPGN